MDKFISLIEKNVNVTDLFNALTITWQGMAAIFVVMAVISLIVLAFTALSSKKK